MTVEELKEKLDSYFERDYGECELKIIDQDGNDSEVLGMFDYADPNSNDGSVVVIKIVNNEK
jgi:hypothetical protein